MAWSRAEHWASILLGNGNWFGRRVMSVSASHIWPKCCDRTTFRCEPDKASEPTARPIISPTLTSFDLFHLIIIRFIAHLTTLTPPSSFFAQFPTAALGRSPYSLIQCLLSTSNTISWCKLVLNIEASWVHLIYRGPRILNAISLLYRQQVNRYLWDHRLHNSINPHNCEWIAFNLGMLMTMT